MELQTADSNNSNTVNESPRCQKRTRKGRCTMLVTDPSSPFCPEHDRAATRFRKAADLFSLLAGGLTDFKSATPINDFLSHLLLLQAQGVIQPRRAAVMAYTCNLLLRTLPAIELELHPPGQEPEFIFDLPRPKRDWPEDADPAVAAHENWNAYVESLRPKAPAPPDDFTACAPTPEKTK